LGATTSDEWRVAGSVRVDRLAHIERYSHLMHLVSHVEGRLKPGLDAFDAFDALCSRPAP
jgi:anthranilate synthase component 1